MEPLHEDPGAVPSIDDLCSSFQEEWLRFTLRVDDLIRAQGERQQELLARLSASCPSGVSASPSPQSDGLDLSGVHLLSACAARTHTEETRATGASSDSGSYLQAAGRHGVAGGDICSRAVVPLGLQPDADAARDLQDVRLVVRRMERMMLSQRQAEEKRRKRMEEFHLMSLRGTRTQESPTCVQEERTDLSHERSSGATPRTFVPGRSFLSITPSRMMSGDESRTRVSDIMEGSRSYARGSFFRKLIPKNGLVEWVDWFEKLEVPEPTGCLAKLVLSRWFESLCIIVIVVNTLFTWYTTNWEMAHIEKDETADFIVHIDQAFVMFYTVELVLKLLVYKKWFFANIDWRWNIFDMVLVIFSLTDFALSMATEAQAGANVTFMRVLRILKMAKLLRGLRVLRFFSELRMLLNSLIGSMLSLLWSIIMLSLMFYIFGLVFVQGAALHVSLTKDTMDPVEFAAIYKDFGSVEAAMLALFRSCTGGEDWTMFYDTINHTGAGYGALYIFFIAFSQIAFLNILTAIFVNKALDLARPDKEALAMEHRRKDIEAYEDLQVLAQELDNDGTGYICATEFDSAVRNGRLGARLSVLGLGVHDAERFFDTLLYASGTEAHEVSARDFVEGCMKLRGPASGVDLYKLDKHTQVIYDFLSTFRRETRQRFAMMAEALSTAVPACSTESDAALDSALLTL